MATLRDYFERDFVVGHGWRFKVGGGEVVVEAELHLDFDANARFVSCYVPSVPDPVSVIEAVSAQIDHAFAMIEGKGIRVGKHGERQVRAEELVFAGRILVYGEDELEEATLDRLTASLKARNMALRHRVPSYARECSAFGDPLGFIAMLANGSPRLRNPSPTAAPPACWPAHRPSAGRRWGSRARRRTPGRSCGRTAPHI